MRVLPSFHLHKSKKSNPYSLDTFDSVSLERREVLWSYVASIRYPEILDWQRHMSLHSNYRNEKDSKKVERRILEQIKKQRNLPVKISDGLYLSDAIGASNINRLKELGITHVLNVGGKKAAILSSNQYKKEGMVRKTIEAKDEYGYPMLNRHLNEALKFVKTAHEMNGNCVIHCLQGINRSCVLVAAIAMLLERKSVLEVVRHCRIQRGNVFMHSNWFFQEELVMLAEKEGLLGPKPGSNEDKLLDDECVGILESFKERYF